ncbi:MAG: 2,3-bisphosphoglycerate-independent phosphoglycerate mutase [Oscillospiraceae bacterium]|nr:2,3-bisphosphoglycerate-independent phosphoglycerate mutase [Oscillospiraceae bacterium]
MANKIALIILDGYGIGIPNGGNAVYMANTPNMDALLAHSPVTQLSASGLDVGLPDGQMGNSEVGHTNIGAGRVVFQTLPKISEEIKSGKFFENEVYAKAMDAAKENGKALHIMGLMSNGGVHSHIEHIFAAMDMAKQRGLETVYVHAFLDGRDVAPTSGKDFVQQLQNHCEAVGNAKIGVVSGRFYAMDRDKRWDRVEQAYNALVLGEGVQADDAVKAIADSYEAGVTDEFVVPTVCCPEGHINEGDSVIFMNFRPDRAREMTWALTLADFDGFERKKTVYPLNFVCTAQYDEKLDCPIAYPPETLECTLGEYVAGMNLKQLRIAETEKYAHVTFFFNGGVETVYPGEDRILIDSPKQFPTYDLIPEMSAVPVQEALCEQIATEKYDMIICNFANCDMVGHTGDMQAAIKAVETVDACVGKVVEACTKHGYIVCITADHGNADLMFDESGKVNTAHTTNPVPFLVKNATAILKPGRLCDIAPTMLELMGLPVPKEMTGESLLLPIVE